MTAEIPKPRPIGSVPEDTPILRAIPDGFIVFQYTMSARVGKQFWLDPLFWSGEDTNRWVASSDGKVPEGTEVFASAAQARDAMRRSRQARPPAAEQAELFG